MHLSAQRSVTSAATAGAPFAVPALTSQLHGYDPKVVQAVEPRRAGGRALYDLTPA